MIEPRRSDRQHREPALADEEGILVRAVGRATILQRAQPPGGNLLVDALVEDDHAIGHVFLQTINDRKFNPALFAPLADGDGLALIQRCRALR